MNLEQIVVYLRTELNRINNAIAALGGLSEDGHRRGRPAGRKMSAAARARMAAAQRARWAKQKRASQPKTTTPPKKSRRGGISAAGRKRLSQMMKKRWAERKKQAKG